MNQDTDVSAASLKAQRKELSACSKMVKETGSGSSVVESETPHKCDMSCLGPLTFHCQAVGDKVRLSRGCRLAERSGSTFKNGLVFSSRPLKIQERIRLRVGWKSSNWHGTLRVGFTNVPPSARSLPLPLMAIPDLTDTPGHWAAPVCDSYCKAGSVLEFWVSSGGSIYVACNNTGKHKLFKGVDLSHPLWAMIDIYGQTRSILLLGSEKKQGLYKRRSCPAPERLTSPEFDYNCSWIPDENSDECMSSLDVEVPEYKRSELDCVVCMGRKARITLPCGHRCLCVHCTSRVIEEFGNCPLCRHEIRALSVEGRGVSGVP